MGTSRVQMIMPDELIQRLDNAAASLNISRTAYVCIACNEKLRNDIMFSSIPEVMDFLRKNQSSQASTFSAEGEFAGANVNRKTDEHSKD